MQQLFNLKDNKVEELGFSGICSSAKDKRKGISRVVGY